MGPFGSRLLVGFDAASVSGGVVSWSLGRPRLRSAARALLTPGALVPSPFEANLARPDEIRSALRQLREALGKDGRRAQLVLPDGLARIVLLELPSGATAQDYGRFRLAQSSPYPIGEASVSALSIGPRRILAASVHKRVIEGYEAAAAAAGFSQGLLTLAPLAATVGIRRGLGGSARTVAVMLGDAALSLAVFDGDTLRVFRNRRRDGGGDEAARIGREVKRTVSMTEARPGAVQLRVVGPGAGRLIREMSLAGWAVEAGWSVASGDDGEAVELPWLGAAAA